ncbi:hypothetical protein B0T19DRAFT_403069 [Cercophora scortea]|uniref:Uncharacterized protein n=1 Tax=Cercophora scortea TaxID=314031 RepID=A0AAE0M5V7_9PEZI|nr:hypothetical protein B0T19DRAFT_403069 [Cercophora scortea]
MNKVSDSPQAPTSTYLRRVLIKEAAKDWMDESSHLPTAGQAAYPLQATCTIEPPVRAVQPGQSTAQLQADYAVCPLQSRLAQPGQLTTPTGDELATIVVAVLVFLASDNFRALLGFLRYPLAPVGAAFVSVGQWFTTTGEWMRGGREAPAGQDEVREDDPVEVVRRNDEEELGERRLPRGGRRLRGGGAASRVLVTATSRSGPRWRGSRSGSQ